jgi:hypothetical protein
MATESAFIIARNEAQSKRDGDRSRAYSHADEWARMEQMTPIKLESGDRVRLTELGVSRSPKIRARTGVIVGLSKHYNGSASIAVLFDGNIRPTTVHKSYVELENAGGSKRPAAFPPTKTT